MKHDGIVIRPLAEPDMPAVLNLLRVSLGEESIPRNLAYWSWKHVQNPFGPSRGLVAEIDGDLIGLRVFMEWKWRAGTSTIRAVRAVDTATHPRHQGRGIFSRLTRLLAEEMRAEGTAFIFNTPNRKSRPGYLKMGWERVGPTTVLIRARHPARILAALTGAGPAPGRTDAVEVAPAPGASAIEIIDAIGAERMKDSALDERLGTASDVRYFRWRFGLIPGFSYGARSDYRDDRGGCVFFRQRAQRWLRELRFCDVLVGTAPGSDVITADLIRDVIGESECDFASAMAAPGTVAFRTLRRGGFIPIPRVGPVLTVRPLNAVHGVDPLRRSAWRLSIGDLELF